MIIIDDIHRIYFSKYHLNNFSLNSKMSMANLATRFIPIRSIIATLLLSLNNCAPQPKYKKLEIDGQSYTFPINVISSVSMNQNGSAWHVRLKTSLKNYPNIKYYLIYQYDEPKFKKEYNLPYLFGNSEENLEKFLGNTIKIEDSENVFCSKKDFSREFRLNLNCGMYIGHGFSGWTAGFSKDDLKYLDIIRNESVKSLNQYKDNSDDGR